MVSRNMVPNYVAGGTIPPRRFVRLSTSAERTILLGTDSAPILGVGPRDVKYPPGTVGSDDTIALVSGDPGVVYGPGEIALVTAGSGGVTKGAVVGSDSVGLGIILTSTTMWAGGRALTAADAGGDFFCLINPSVGKETIP